jgi:hypothetical protein
LGLRIRRTAANGVRGENRRTIKFCQRGLFASGIAFQQLS